MNSKSYTLITGASTGIGYALAKEFAAHGHHLILVARSQEKLAALKQDLEAQYPIQAKVILKDLSGTQAAQELFHEIQMKNLPVENLVNNAGIGAYGFFSKTQLAKEWELLQINIISLTTLTKLFLNSMLEAGKGGILNVASTAAFQPGPGMAVYYASKAYVLSFSEAIRSELRGSGVTVSALCPGPTHSDFHRRADLDLNRNYIFKPWLTMTAEAVAQKGYEGFMKGKARILPGFWNQLTPLGMRFLPRDWVTEIVHTAQSSRMR